MKLKLSLGLVLLGVAPLAPMLLTYAQARPANVPIHTPKAGSKERAAIMEAARVPVSMMQKTRVIFNNVGNFHVGGGWAFFHAATVDSKGRALDEEGVMFDYSTLLYLEKGKWRVVEWAYHGDVIQIDWAHDHPDVPLNVLGLKPSDLG